MQGQLEEWLRETVLSRDDKIVMESVTYPQFLVEDARNLGKFVPENSIDTIITSPPYYGRKRYTKLTNEIGREKSLDLYLDNLRLVFEKCYRATKRTGSIWVIIDGYRENGHYIPLPFLVFRELESCGWIPRDIVVWDKVKTRPWIANGKYYFFKDRFEFILFFSKSDKYKFYIDRIREIEPKEFKHWWLRYPERYNPSGKAPSNLWSFLIPTQGWGKNYIRHFCPFPPALVERIIKLTSDEGDFVLDPFAGSGIVMAVAHALHRKAIGFDICDKYKKQFKRVVVQITSQMNNDVKQNMRSCFSEVLKRLKLVKLPQFLLKEVQKEGVLAVIVEAEDTCETISIVLDSNYLHRREELSRVLKTKINQLPHWKFGIKAKLGSIGDNYRLNENAYWIYIDNYYPLRRIRRGEDLTSFLDSWKSKSLPFLINVNTEPVLSKIIAYLNSNEDQYSHSQRYQIKD